MSGFNLFHRTFNSVSGLISSPQNSLLPSNLSKSLLPILTSSFSTSGGADLRRYHPHLKKKYSFAPNEFDKKPAQDWWDYDGFGKYKARYHQYPSNKVLRDVQRRRIFAQHAEERNRVNCLFRNDILPKELQELARHKITYEVPRDSAITRPNRRCAITGRARGIWHQFRASRMVVRQEADYNRLSGVQRAKWLYNTHLDP